MFNVKIVGCGALGSALVDELAKQVYAHAIPISLTLFDFDKVEAPRNLVSQNFRQEDVGKVKSVALAKRFSKEPFAEIHALSVKLDPTNIAELLQADQHTIIVDAVDNIPTRQMLYEYGMAVGAAICHSGISQTGSGYCGWNYKGYDTYPFKDTDPTKVAEPKTLPPCELSHFRSLIVNTSMATICSLMLFLGWEISGQIEDPNQKNPVPGVLSTWQADRAGFRIIEKLLGVEEF